MPAPLITYQPIESDAFVRASLRSERYRVIGLLCLCAFFILLNVTVAVLQTRELRRALLYLSFWAVCAGYECTLLLATRRAERANRPIPLWILILNTILECSVPTFAILGVTLDKGYLGPYRALTGSGVALYCLFVILSTLRLRASLCILAGAVSAAGYSSAYLFTLVVAPNNPARRQMPAETYLINAILLLIAGVLAAFVAQQIRRHLVAALAEAETRRKLDRVEHDLSVARSIQMGLLPKGPPNLPGYAIAGWSQPADSTGGDYYDWIELPGGRLLVTIADAAGHGIGPALLIAACRAYFRAVATHDDPLESITRQVDALLAADCPGDRFITAAVCLLDPAAHTLSLYSAGHAPTFFYSAATHSIETFDADQPPLGTNYASDPADPPSRARTLCLNPGDALILVTDGFFESPDPAGRPFGIPSLASFLRDQQALPPADLIARLHAALLTHCSTAPQSDDLTALILKRAAS